MTAVSRYRGIYTRFSGYLLSCIAVYVIKAPCKCRMSQSVVPNGFRPSQLIVRMKRRVTFVVMYTSATINALLLRAELEMIQNVHGRRQQ